MFRTFAWRIILPTLLSVALFAGAIFLVLIPAFERSMMERKREMIRELTNSAWNILANHEQQVKEGNLTREEAQARALRQIQDLHYGSQMKDYFWVNDMHPRMVVHPYRHDLIGKDLTDFVDPTGARPFVEMVDVVRRNGAGFVQYQWQWKDDPGTIVPKLSYVKGFQPWGWIIGTGIYIQDVREEIGRITRRLIGWSSAILLMELGLLGFIMRQSWSMERKRRLAEEGLRASEERYRAVVESAGESILMDLGEGRLYANASAEAMLGYSASDLDRMGMGDLVVEGEWGGATERESREVVLRRKDGTQLHMLLSASPISVGGKSGSIYVATDITRRKAAERELGRSADRLREEVADLRARSSRHQAAMEELRLTLAMLQHASGGVGEFKLLEDIRQAGSADEVVRLNRSLPTVVRALSDSGAPAGWMNRLITLDSDAVLRRLSELAIETLGPPPAPFVFLVMGSEGRREQTLSTDQDNAILFGDVPPEALPAAQAYFAELGTRVCDDLNAAGYAWCEGEVMAKNPRWCQPLSVWKRYFSGWINTLEAQDLLQAKIFFDFRAGFGEAALAEKLRQSLWEQLAQAPRFFTQLAGNVLLFAPPVGVFGQFHLESAPDGRRGLGIKSAMTPVVDFARIYALRHRIAETGTSARLAALRDAGVLQDRNFHEINEVYGALMQIRIANQVRALREGRRADNFVEPSSLSYLEQRILKESFTQIRHFQTRLSYDFTGMAEAPK